MTGRFDDLGLYRRRASAVTMGGMYSAQGIAMTAAHRRELTTQQLDQFAWGFLRSEFTGQVYADWPIDRRVDAYLLHHGLTDIVDDGSAHDALLNQIMASIGPAHRNGVLAPPRT